MAEIAVLSHAGCARDSSGKTSYGVSVSPKPTSTRSREDTPGSASGKSSLRNNVKRWKRVHEQSAMLRLTELRNVKKVEVKASKENARKIARKIPVELLAKEWLTVSEASVETRAYILDKVMPTLILGVEKLLNAVNERGLTNPEAAGGFDPDFNPINFLAQYLHRNNPRYSNFSEASPYVRGMRQVTEELKAQLFDLEDNRLARLKAEAKRKRADRELLATLKQQERDRRHTLLSNQFAAWKVPTDKGRVELSLVQNALRSFMEVAAQFPPEIEEVTLTQFSQPLESTDQTGTTLSVNEFAQYLLLYIDSLPSEVFDNFMDHLSKCATAHQESAERENRRVVLTNLFIYCDHSGIGLLDRHRILSLFEQFWDVYEDSKKNFINPRRWPVVEVDEADDSLNDEEEPTETDHEPVTDNVGATDIESEDNKAYSGKELEGGQQANREGGENVVSPTQQSGIKQTPVTWDREQENTGGGVEGVRYDTSHIMSNERDKAAIVGNNSDADNKIESDKPRDNATGNANVENAAEKADEEKNIEAAGKTSHKADGAGSGDSKRETGRGLHDADRSKAEAGGTADFKVIAEAEEKECQTTEDKTGEETEDKTGEETEGPEKEEKKERKDEAQEDTDTSAAVSSDVPTDHADTVGEKKTDTRLDGKEPETTATSSTKSTTSVDANCAEAPTVTVASSEAPETSTLRDKAKTPTTGFTLD